MRAIIIDQLLQVAKTSPHWTLQPNKDELLGSDILNKMSKELESVRDKRQGKTQITTKDLNYIVENVIDSILLLNNNIGQKDSLALEYYLCYKKLFVAEILNLLMMKSAASHVANDAFKSAKKFMFVKLTFQALRIIYTNHNLEGNGKKEQRAVNEFNTHLEYYQIECDIEITRNEIFRYYNHYQANNPKILEACIKAENKFSKYAKKIPSFFFHNYYFMIIHIKNTILKNHSDLYKNSEEAINWFQKNAPKYRPGILVYTYIQIVYTIQKREFDKCESLLDSMLKIVTFKSIHWFRIKENQTLLNLHREAYTEAAMIFFDAYSSKSFLSISKLDQERWRLYESYIQFLISIGQASPPEKTKRFSPTRLINDLPRFSKDKRAMNIPMLIIQMLFLIIKKRYNEAADRIDALGKYSTRYLLNDETFRSNCFIKMLLTIPKSGFNKKLAERLALPFLNKMVTSEIELIDQPFEIEIIPYENLWKILIEHLSNKHHYRDNRAKPKAKPLKLKTNR